MYPISFLQGQLELEQSMQRTEEFLSGRYSKDMAICQKTIGELDQRINMNIILYTHKKI
jgi:hypothetical protein